MLFSSRTRAFVTHRPPCCFLFQDVRHCDWSDATAPFSICSGHVALMSDISPCHFAESSLIIPQLFLAFKIYSPHFDLFKLRTFMSPKEIQWDPSRAATAALANRVRWEETWWGKMAAINQVNIFGSACGFTQVSHTDYLQLVHFAF